MEALALSNKLFIHLGELDLGQRDFQSGALTTGPQQQARFAPVKLHTDSYGHWYLLTTDCLKFGGRRGEGGILAFHVVTTILD